MHNRIINRGVIGLLLGGLLSGCGQMQPVGSRSEMIDYEVRRGDTLYSIAWRYGYDPREVAAWNSIPSPYTIYPGQHIYIIPPYQRHARKGAPSNQVASRPTTRSSVTPGTPVSKPAPRPAQSKPVVTAAPSVKKVENGGQRLHNTNVSWNWPTAGKLLTRFSPAKGKKGIDIGGKLGQPVQAAADGKVVYSGNGLIGYGNLIIIKHNDTYLSAYGHNKRLLVEEGSMVKQGQKIAEMGNSGKEGVVLHFEIRRDGKPVDPMRYLPQQGS